MRPRQAPNLRPQQSHQRGDGDTPRMLILFQVISVLALLAAQPARAYECTQVPDSSGNPVGASTAWFKRAIPHYFNKNGTASLDPNGTFAVLQNSFAVWQNVTLRDGQDPACRGAGTNLQLGGPNLTSQSFVGYDFLASDINENILVFRDHNWTHDINTIALTTTTYNALTGEIFDADIEFNSQHFTFSIDPNRVLTDLMNTATHEIGHSLGFAHSLDANATMYGIAPAHDVQKQKLACDDAAIVTLRYPANSTKVGYCVPSRTACLSCAPPGVLQFDPAITVLDTDDGRGGCQALPPSLWVLAGCPVLLRVFRRRRPR